LIKNLAIKTAHLYYFNLILLNYPRIIYIILTLLYDLIYNCIISLNTSTDLLTVTNKIQ